MATLHQLLVFLMVLAFGMATIQVASRVNLIALGLLFWSLMLLLGL